MPNLPVAAYFAAGWLRAMGVPTVGVLHSDDPFYRALQDAFVFGSRRFRLSGLACVSRQLENQVIMRRPADTRVWRIPYGVPVPIRSVERIPGKLRLAFVGRLAEEQKRISEVTRALCRAMREIPGIAAVLFGDGPDRHNVERILAAAGDDLAVRLGGRIPSDHIQTALLECDVLVLLSDYEGLPIALMEAMACGCVPVCLRMRSGIPELVDHGVTGLLIDDRDDGFIAAVRRLHDETGLWERLSAAAKARIETGFSDAVCNRQWAAMLHEFGDRISHSRPLKVPSLFRLPARNPALETTDNRRRPISLPLRLWRCGRMLAGRVKRRLFGQPVP